MHSKRKGKRKENHMDEENLSNEVVLNDENGNEVRFEFLDIIELDSEQYAILLPIEEDDENEGEVVILKIEDNGEDSDEETYVSVDDEETLNKVFQLFKEEFKDEFNFTDDED